MPERRSQLLALLKRVHTVRERVQQRRVVEGRQQHDEAEAGLQENLELLEGYRAKASEMAQTPGGSARRQQLFMAKLSELISARRAQTDDLQRRLERAQAQWRHGHIRVKVTEAALEEAKRDEARELSRKLRRSASFHRPRGLGSWSMIKRMDERQD